MQALNLCVSSALRFGIRAWVHVWPRKRNVLLIVAKRFATVGPFCFARSAYMGKRRQLNFPTVLVQTPRCQVIASAPIGWRCRARGARGLCDTDQWQYCFVLFAADISRRRAAQGNNVGAIILRRQNAACPQASISRRPSAAPSNVAPMPFSWRAQPSVGHSKPMSRSAPALDLGVQTHKHAG